MKWRDFDMSVFTALLSTYCIVCRKVSGNMWKLADISAYSLSPYTVM